MNPIKQTPQNTTPTGEGVSNTSVSGAAPNTADISSAAPTVGSDGKTKEFEMALEELDSASETNESNPFARGTNIAGNFTKVNPFAQNPASPMTANSATPASPTTTPTPVTPSTPNIIGGTADETVQTANAPAPTISTSTVASPKLSTGTATADAMRSLNNAQKQDEIFTKHQFQNVTPQGDIVIPASGGNDDIILVPTADSGQKSFNWKIGAGIGAAAVVLVGVIVGMIAMSGGDKTGSAAVAPIYSEEEVKTSLNEFLNYFIYGTENDEEISENLLISASYIEEVTYLGNLALNSTDASDQLTARNLGFSKLRDFVKKYENVYGELAEFSEDKLALENLENLEGYLNYVGVPNFSGTTLTDYFSASGYDATENKIEEFFGWWTWAWAGFDDELGNNYQFISVKNTETFGSYSWWVRYRKDLAEATLALADLASQLGCLDESFSCVDSEDATYQAYSEKLSDYRKFSSRTKDQQYAEAWEFLKLAYAKLYGVDYDRLNLDNLELEEE